MNDEHWMKQALRLAEKGRGRTSPNPMVGALLVRGDQGVGRGYHAKAGEPHAEILALQQSGVEARGATLYINLEPCTHFGKTPPCAPQVIAAGVKRVVIGMEDPNPRVRGRGIESLKQAGLEVRVGVMEEACRKLNEAFCKYIVMKEPYVILKVASTLDGRIAARNGDSKWITGQRAREFVHRLRDRVDGVLVGIETVLRDDPLLTARIKGGRDPYRILLDSRLRLPEDARILGPAPSRVIIGTTEQAPKERVERFMERGVRVLILDSEGGRVPVRPFLKGLGDLGIMILLVEGGSRVNSAFLEEGCVDKFYFFFSMKWLGDPEAYGIFEGPVVKRLVDAVRLQGVRARKIGEDFLLEGYVKGEHPCSQGL
jgi:diaminohydroxyphosphoribosylaminopyrimidine deaminase/5-amino-6-(5-phosphoribosylamino)uracil reductase